MESLMLALFPPELRHLFKYLTIAILAFTGRFLCKLVIFLGLCFARIINLVFFPLFMALRWIMGFFSSTGVDSEGMELHGEMLMAMDPDIVAPVVKKGNPKKGLIRVQVCNTDLISELDLDGGGREWEDRVGWVISREELDDKVAGWAEGVLKED